jgi:hypothetical protein
LLGAGAPPPHFDAARGPFAPHPEVRPAARRKMGPAMNRLQKSVSVRHPGFCGGAGGCKYGCGTKSVEAPTCRLRCKGYCGGCTRVAVAQAHLQRDIVLVRNSSLRRPSNIRAARRERAGCGGGRPRNFAGHSVSWPSRRADERSACAQLHKPLRFDA